MASPKISFVFFLLFFFFNDTAPTEIYTLSLHDALPIRRLTAAVGFRYAWDEAIRQYAHPTGLVILTPQGRIARYLFGVDYAPKDLRLALLESAGGGIGTLADRLLLLCYRYDPRAGRY